MSRYSSVGCCESCDAEFRYFLVENESNDTAYGYCDRCGGTVLLSFSGASDRDEVTLEAHGPIPEAVASRLAACSCGGAYRGSASPRCPSCRKPLSASKAREWLEANARRRKPEWSWQGSWQGAYSIVIENQIESDLWSDE